ncbi:MAG: hypothetical protein ACLTLD_07810, partial [Alphaproteobacteria bacterium]
SANQGRIFIIHLSITETIPITECHKREIMSINNTERIYFWLNLFTLSAGALKQKSKGIKTFYRLKTIKKLLNLCFFPVVIRQYWCIFVAVNNLNGEKYVYQ